MLGDCGFAEIDLTDITNWFRIEAQSEYERMKGPLNGRMAALLGDEKTAHFVENWRQLVVVIDNGELRPVRFRARKPS